MTEIILDTNETKFLLEVLDKIQFSGINSSVILVKIVEKLTKPKKEILPAEVPKMEE